MIFRLGMGPANGPKNKLGTPPPGLLTGCFEGCGAVVTEEYTPAGRVAFPWRGLLPVLHDVCEGELQMVLGRVEHEVLGVKVHQCVQQDVGGVGAQLFRLPQVLLLNPANQLT